MRPQPLMASGGRPPAMDFLKTLARQFPGLPVIAEDLGGHHSGGQGSHFLF